jgi:uncharacterized protein (TIGR03067 family)
MRYFFSLLAVGCFLLATNAAQDDLAKKDISSLQGIWQSVSGEEDGKAMPEEKVKANKLTIKDNKWTFVEGIGQPGAGEVTTKLNPSKKPKELDATSVLQVQGKLDGKDFHGIYSIEGDTLKICVTEPGAKRPTEFKGGKGVVLIVFARQKK